MSKIHGIHTSEYDFKESHSPMLFVCVQCRSGIVRDSKWTLSRRTRDILK